MKFINELLSDAKQNIKESGEWIESKSANAWKGVKDIIGDLSNKNANVNKTKSSKAVSNSGGTNSNKRRKYSMIFNETDKKLIENTLVQSSRLKIGDKLNFKGLETFVEGVDNANSVIGSLPKVTNKNIDNLYDVNIKKAFAKKFKDDDMINTANKQNIEILCENAFDRDYKEPYGLDICDFNSIIERGEKATDDIKDFFKDVRIFNKPLEQYRNSDGNIQFFNMTSSSTSSVSVDDKNRFGSVAGDVSASVESGVNKVDYGLFGDVKGIYNIDSNLVFDASKKNKLYNGEYDLSFDNNGSGFNVHLGNPFDDDLDDPIMSVGVNSSFPIKKGDNSIGVGGSLGLNSKGEVAQCEFGLQNHETGEYTKYKINGKMYYKTVVVLVLLAGVAVTVGAAAAELGPLIDSLASQGVLIPA